MDKVKKIPLKNYLVLGAILLISIFLVYYLYLWYITYEESRLNTPIMDHYLQVINYNEIDSYITENKEAVIYVSILENKEIRDFEVKFKNTINELNLNNDILYLDLTSVTYDSSLLEEAINKYTIKDKNVNNLPCIMIFSEGKLVDIYNIKANDYNINNLVLYLEDKEIIDD